MNYVIVALASLSLVNSTAVPVTAQAREGIRVRGHWIVTVRNADQIVVQISFPFG